MKTDTPVLTFATRDDFRAWLAANAETSEGVWLVFGKTKTAAKLTANDALEEALCFGWIDGQMKSVDETCYHKYFARRRTKSPWSEKNKQLTDKLRAEERMTPLGEKAIETAKHNGTWNAPKREPITGEQIAMFTEKLAGFSPAYENFTQMSPSVQTAYTGRYFSFKTEEARQRDLLKIVERLNNNLKPM